MIYLNKRILQLAIGQHHDVSQQNSSFSSSYVCTPMYFSNTLPLAISLQSDVFEGSIQGKQKIPPDNFISHVFPRDNFISQVDFHDSRLP